MLFRSTPAFAERIRARVTEATGIPGAHVLLNSSHTHAGPWPGAAYKLGGETDGWTDLELRYWDSLPDQFASCAVRALRDARPARVSGGVGHAPGIAVNRRERTPDGRTILGWNPDGFFDDSVPTLRIDALDGTPVATIVGFGCHPVVVGPDVDAIGSDFVGPLRDRVELLRGGGVAIFQILLCQVLPRLKRFLKTPDLFQEPRLVTADVAIERSHGRSRFEIADCCLEISHAIQGHRHRPKGG